MKVVASVLALLWMATPVWAAHPMKVEDLHRLTRVGGARLSPDGKWVAFTGTRSDVPSNRSVTNIWVVPAGGGEARPLTFATKGSDRKSTRLNSSHIQKSRMPSSA